MKSNVTELKRYRKPLSEREQRFVDGVAIHGLNDRQAGRYAGMPDTSVCELAARPHVLLAIAEQKAVNARKLELTRDKVLRGIQDAIDRAITLGEPMTEIAGWREAAKICGFYDTPPKDKDLTDKQKRFLQMIQELPEEQLLSMMAKDVSIIDATTGSATPETDQG